MKTNTITWILRLLLLTFVGYGIFNVISLNVRIADKEVQKAALEAQINTQTLENQEIQENLEGEFTEEEIAEIARDKLGYSLPGERIFVDITGK
ncbi:MAG: septum formation initiator family protein [Clostridia bacterium]|nr:septum formation initiator family protein [Oscillospiraceae bacterium]MBR6748693.1 septum formation initiator family protein [Clostridia bacterium]